MWAESCAIRFYSMQVSFIGILTTRLPQLNPIYCHFNNTIYTFFTADVMNKSQVYFCRLDTSCNLYIVISHKYQAVRKSVVKYV